MGEEHGMAVRAGDPAPMPRQGGEDGFDSNIQLWTAARNTWDDSDAGTDRDSDGHDDVNDGGCHQDDGWWSRRMVMWTHPMDYPGLDHRGSSPLVAFQAGARYVDHRHLFEPKLAGDKGQTNDLSLNRKSNEKMDLVTR
jgi:hypothetical protein